MKCYLCNQDTLNTKKITYKVNMHEKTFIIKNAPVQSCSNCMEDFFDIFITNNIEKMIDIANVSNRTDDVIVIDYDTMISTLDNFKTEGLNRSVK